MLVVLLLLGVPGLVLLGRLLLLLLLVIVSGAGRRASTLLLRLLLIRPTTTNNTTADTCNCNSLSPSRSILIPQGSLLHAILPPTLFVKAKVKVVGGVGTGTPPRPIRKERRVIEVGIDDWDLGRVPIGIGIGQGSDCVDVQGTVDLLCSGSFFSRCCRL